MARQLQILLGSDDPTFRLSLHDLERASGQAGIDVRLLGEIIQLAHQAMREIGLDPQDTTAEELYHALVSHDGDPEIFADTHYAGLVFDGQVISLNYGDIVKNRRRHFTERSLDGMRRNLRSELAARYAKHPSVPASHAKRLLGNEPAPVDQRAGSETRPSLLAIGDIFTDAFIKLDEDTTKIITEKDGREWLALPFGQKPPYEKVDIVKSVGPSPNAAVSASRLGLNVSLMAWIGDDVTGEEALAHLKREHVDTTDMVVENGKLTSYWYVLRYGADRTMLVKSEKYTYQWHAPQATPDWIYLSYIGEDSWPLHKELIEYLGANPQVRLAFQPGTFHFKWGAKKLAKIYRRAEIVVMNREEAADVTKKSPKSVKTLADALHALGPTIVVITDGPHGSYASFDGKLVTIPNYPDPKKPLDRTGAGDAFASTIVSGLALGKTMDEALTWAPINSMNVVQHLGAQAGLLDQKTIQKHLKSAPRNYKVTELKT